MYIAAFRARLQDILTPTTSCEKRFPG